MGGLQSGGGTSAVAASAHAGCERFRMTDPFLTQKTRKTLATHIGQPDTSAGIPEARWMRAMTFESLVRSEKFVSELLTKTVGQLDLPRPKQVARITCGGSVNATAKAIAAAHLKASFAGTATMITALGVPFLHLEHEPATAVQPDFAIVAPRMDGGRVVGSWLIMGDAKDYERVRSRINDPRMLKGFLQVALGAESAAAWSELPKGMVVHRYGALAVPRNAFLQPEAVVELLNDHCTEVRVRALERLAAKEKLGEDRPTEDELADYVAHLVATFDPRSCVTCNLFSYCRAELRASDQPSDLLTEIGIERHLRQGLSALVVGAGVGAGPVDPALPEAVIAQVRATISGVPVWTGRPRTDPVGLPGTIHVVLVKSDAAALGVHGIAIQRVGVAGPQAWAVRTFIEPQSPVTRRAVMDLLGQAIQACLDEVAGPVHLIVPDRATADLLATAADSLAGVELSRLRWQHDVDMGRQPLTFDGEKAIVPDPLTPTERLGVSFLLEEDRARALTLRSPMVDVRGVLGVHLIAGGPASDSGRLDYLVRWAQATTESPIDHRVVSDEIAGQDETPGARLSNTVSDAMHTTRKTDLDTYRTLVTAALDYRISVLENAVKVLEDLPNSRLRAVHRTLEGDAQVVWLRRLALQASDLVRFSRTYRFWRNALVDVIDTDTKCHDQLTVLADTAYARDRAIDAGVRELALAVVVDLDPVRLDVRSRRLRDGTEIVALHLNDQAIVERPTTTLKIQAGSFKFGQLPIGHLEAIDGTTDLVWNPGVPIPLVIGDQLVIADLAWFGGGFKSGHELAVVRPGVDAQVAPKATCLPGSYSADPATHQWCCKPHTINEAAWSDSLAERRSRGELNPEAWPPLVDEERFDVGPNDDVPELPDTPVPGNLTPDDLGD